MNLLNKHIVGTAAALCLTAGFAGSAAAIDRICFPTQDGGEICITIPLLIDHRWFDPNPPDPLTPVFDPRRIEQWITTAEGPLPDPWSTDLVILTNISVLAQGLSEGRREALLGSLAETEKALSAELPAGARLAGP